MIYKCTVTDGGGTEYDGGDFEIVETPKSVTFICVRHPFFDNRMSQREQLAENIYANKNIKINKAYSKKKARADNNYHAWRLKTEPMEHIAYFNNGHVARHWIDDDTWTVYPNQCGIPHFLEPTKTVDNFLV